METTALVLFLAMLVFFIVNGLVFFRKGRHSVAWFMTLLPFLLSAGVLVAFQTARVPALLPPEAPIYPALQIVATVLCAGAIALFAYTVGTHRVPPPMWHQSDDLPTEVVTWGAYQYVRHPFYSSYFLYYTGLALLAPAWPTFALVLYAYAMLYYTAVKEERQLAESRHANAYARYMQRTGRFFPPLLRLESSTN